MLVDIQLFISSVGSSVSSLVLEAIIPGTDV